MGLARFINKQFIDVIDWTEEGDDVLAWRFPTADLEIQQGAALIVRDTQTAVFVDEGRVADRFEGGRYVLHTKNLPVLTNLRHWAKLFESPFKSEVYFFSTRQRLGQTFGTPQPVTIRDREFGSVQVRAFGVYSFRIVDAGRFHLQVSGTRDVYRVADLEGQLRAVLASALAADLGAGAIAVPRSRGEPAGARGGGVRARDRGRRAARSPDRRREDREPDPPRRAATASRGAHRHGHGRRRRALRPFPDRARDPARGDERRRRGAAVRASGSAPASRWGRRWRRRSPRARGRHPVTAVRRNAARRRSASSPPPAAPACAGRRPSSRRVPALSSTLDRALALLPGVRPALD